MPKTHQGDAFLKPSLAIKTFLVLVLLLAGAEASLGLAKNQAGFFKFFHNQIPSPEILRDWLAASTRGVKPLVVILGDSVVYGSGLHAHGVRAWREQTIAAFLQKQLPQYTVVDLSLDGALPGDYLALYASVRKLKPAWIILEFNYRMYAQKYASPADTLSRPWLSDGQTNPLFPHLQATLGDKIVAVLRRSSLLFRYTEAWRSAIFFPSREEVFNQLLQNLLPARAWQDPGDKELLLKLKLKPYYYSPVLRPEHAALQAGHLLLEALNQDRQRSLLFFTPQNLAFIEDIADQNAFAQNLGILDAALGAHPADRQYYFNWFNLYPQEAFFDHCHLLPRYNELLAGKLTEIISRGGQPDHVQQLE
jgi:hypothetical protein